MNKKITFFDIDGTLAIGKEIPKEHIKALEELRKRGTIVIICTGRPVLYAKKMFGNMADGFICGNGRYGIYGHRVIVDKPIDVEEIERIERIFSDIGNPYMFSGIENGFSKNYSIEEIEGLNEAYCKGFYDKRYNKDNIKVYQFDVKYNDENMRERLIKELSESVILNFHGEDHPSADCTLRSFDKGHSIEIFLKELNISKEDSYFFGDGSNDLPPFRTVGNKIAMGNAVEELKKEATYVTDHILEHGIVNALKHFELI